jgi:O-antigen/teichoic acid export membrane protein
MEKLTYRKIFIFWLPLAATWLMMSVEGPFIAAVIARLAEPKYNLAAYGVAFSFALIIEAPIIMIMSASTALVEGRESFFKLRNYTYFLNALITLAMVVFLIPDIFQFIAVDLIELPQKVADLTYWATVVLLPWPGTIGYRRFYQGILIRNNQTRRVAYGTIIRLSSMAGTAFILYINGNVDGVVVGAAALSAGVTIEAIASRLMSIRIVRNIRQKTDDTKQISYMAITKFYYPLAMTSILALGVHPLVTFFVGQSRFAIESLAVLPVITSLVFIFRAIGLSYQEVAISLVGKKLEGYKVIRNFAYFLAIMVVVILTTIAFSPLAIVWLHSISGLSMELTNFARVPLQIMCLMPGLSVLLSLQRAILVATRKTAPITWATASEVFGIIIVMFIGISYMDVIGAIAATSALIIGRLAANLYVVPAYVKAIGRRP